MRALLAGRLVYLHVSHFVHLDPVGIQSDLVGALMRVALIELAPQLGELDPGT